MPLKCRFPKFEKLPTSLLSFASFIEIEKRYDCEATCSRIKEEGENDRGRGWKWFDITIIAGWSNRGGRLEN